MYSDNICYLYLISLLWFAVFVNGNFETEPKCQEYHGANFCRDVSRICVSLDGTAKCVPKRGFNESCYHDDQCVKLSSMICLENTCHCKSGLQWNQLIKNCIPILSMDQMRGLCPPALSCPKGFACIPLKEPVPEVAIKAMSGSEKAAKMFKYFGATIGIYGGIILVITLFFYFSVKLIQ